MTNRRSLRSVAIALLLTLALASCGGGSDGESSSGGTTTPGDEPSLPECPLDALSTAEKPVPITYWHAMTRENEQELIRQTNEFNAAQKDVKVTLSPSASYTDNTTRYKAGLSTGKLPDLMQGEDSSVQTLIDSQAILPAASCLKADGANTDDVIPRVVAYYSVEDVLYAMPFNNSNPILYYDKAVFTRAGLDPAKPPTTFAEVKAASDKIVKSGAAKFGIALKTDSWPIEHWLAKAGQIIVDNDNGRSARATKVAFDNPTGVSVFAWVDDMVRSKLALSTGTSDFDHYLAVGNGQAAMTIDTSAALGTITKLFAAGQYKNVKLGAGPMPGPASPDGGVLVGGAANFIVNKSAPEKQAAAYQFAKFLSAPQTQSEWAAATGYVPISKSAVTMSPLREVYAQKPEYKVAYDQLLDGPTNPATAGPVLGPYGSAREGMRGAIVDALSRMIQGDLTPEQAVDAAAEQANTAISEYNSRIGG